MLRKWKGIALTLVLGVTMSFNGFIIANADDDSTASLYNDSSKSKSSVDSTGKVTIDIPQSEQTAVKEILKKVNDGQETLQGSNPGDTLSNQKLFNISDDGSKITFNEHAFRQASEKSAKQNMKTFANALTNSQVSSETQQYIFDLVTNSNPDASVILIPLLMDSTKADIYSAMKIVEPFLGLMRVVFGIGAVVIVLLLTTSTIIDLCYVGLPMCRGEKDNKPVIPFVSVDAESVVKEVESSIGGGNDTKYKNAYVMYFKRRAFTYIILAVCLLYLIAGELGGVISWFLNLASGLV